MKTSTVTHSACHSVNLLPPITGITGYNTHWNLFLTILRCTATIKPHVEGLNAVVRDKVSLVTVLHVVTLLTLRKWLVGPPLATPWATPWLVSVLLDGDRWVGLEWAEPEEVELSPLVKESFSSGVPSWCEVGCASVRKKIVCLHYPYHIEKHFCWGKILQQWWIWCHNH